MILAVAGPAILRTCELANTIALVLATGCSAVVGPDGGFPELDPDLPSCGDGVVQGDEECDRGDRNAAAGSACSAQCTVGGDPCEQADARTCASAFRSAVCKSAAWKAGEDCAASDGVCEEGACVAPDPCDARGQGGGAGPFILSCDGDAWTQGASCADQGAFCLTGACVESLPTPDPEPVGPLFAAGDAPFGVPMSEYNAAYLNWRSFDAHRQDCSLNQPPGGEIWFVADHDHDADDDGGDGQVDQPARVCTMPGDRSLYIGGPRHICVACPELGTRVSECPLAEADELIECAEQAGPPADRIPFIQLDGQALDTGPGDVIPPHTFRYGWGGSGPSERFHLKDSVGPDLPPEDTDCLAPWQEDNACHQVPGPRLVSMTGYGFLFRPLPPGEHVIDYYVQAGGGGIRDHLRILLSVTGEDTSGDADAGEDPDD